jgi:hypothetical protein
MADAISEEIASSNMSRPAKSAIRRWYESMGGAGIKRHVTETAQVVRQGGESAIMGGALGLIEAEHGSLDIKVGQHELPVDGAAAAVGLIGSVVMANDATGLSADMRNLGAGALAILSYRKAKEWRLRHKGQHTGLLSSGGAHHGDVIDMNDPVLAAAARLGR